MPLEIHSFYEISNEESVCCMRERREEARLCDSLNAWGFIRQLWNNAVNL